MVLIDKTKLGALVSSAKQGVTTLVQSKGKKANADQEVLEGELTPEQAEKGGKMLQNGLKKEKTFDKIIDNAKKGVNGIVKAVGINQPLLEKGGGKDSVGDEKIKTIEQLKTNLEPVEKEMSPEMLQVLKSQLQVLGTISSPTMTGMMIDNLIQGLKLSLDKAEQNNVSFLKESYTRLIQNYVFMAEAKMHYAVDKNKEESRRLLAECGQMLATTFSDIAKAAIPGAQVSSILKSIDSKSLYDITSSVAHILISKKKAEEKEKEFYDTIENLFDTFEKYPDLFGKSIVINGMLSKYRKILVKRYEDSKINIIKNKKSVAELQKASQLSNDLINTFQKGDIRGMVSSGIQSLLNVFISRKSAQYDLQTFFMTFDAYDTELKNLKASLSEEENRLKELEQQKKQVGLLNFSGKKEATKSIKEQLAKLDENKKEVFTAEKKLKELKALLPEAKALKEDINRYESRLIGIEQLYLF